MLLVGDIHGSVDFWSGMCGLAADLGVDTIVQLGDFGFWPPLTRLERWVEAISEPLRHFGLKARALDGNHDWHPGVRRQFPIAANGLRPVTDVLDWADRGARWEWHGRRFAALGGAVSIDMDYRVAPGDSQGRPESWWPTEAITGDEYDRLVAGGPCDVLLTHDAPLGHGPNFAPLPLPLQARVDANRRLVSDAVRATTPQLLVHGHLHARYQSGIRTGDNTWTTVEGLASNNEDDRGSWAVLGLADLTLCDDPPA